MTVNGHAGNRYTMAKPKLMMSDLRMSRSGTIIAAPVCAFELSSLGPWYTEIRELWEPIHAERKRKSVELELDRKALLDRLIKTASDPNVGKEERDGAITRLSIRAKLIKNAPSERRPGPSLGNPTSTALKECVVCGREFFGLGNVSACTEKCAKTRRDSTRTRGTTLRDPVYHHPRRCKECGEPFKPRRSDAAYCSARCRIARHRARLA